MSKLATALSPILIALALMAGAVPGASASTPAHSAEAAAPALGAAQQGYLSLARAAVARAERRWGDRRRGWYDARLHDADRYPLATIWDIVPLFQALDAIAIAQPTAADRAAVTRFAGGAERYLNHGLHPGPGYSPYPGDRAADTETWFDDNGWWGLAFVNAYRATGAKRWLTDAKRALDYIAAAGWDPDGGGIWWNTLHPYKAGEALASGSLLATLLYQQTHDPRDLAVAQKFLAWGNTAGFSAANGLYAGSNLEPTPIDYIESPLIYAQAVLCQITGTAADCERAEAVKTVALKRFGQMLDFSPQYDAIYLQWMLALYSLDHDPGLYSLAAENAHAAAAHALNGEGLYLLSWSGGTLPLSDARPGMLQTQAATASLFAWLAVYPPPQ